MANSVLCVKCGKWIFVCGRCKKQANVLVGSVEELCEELETVKSFSLLFRGQSECKWWV